MSNLLAEVKDYLNRTGSRPKRSLGQNFLVNSQVVEKILARALSLEPRSLVEIGPGLGALTQPLRARFGGRLVLLELDHHFCEAWRDQGYEVVEGDALKLNWDHLGLESPSLLLSNLPYQISSSLVIERSLGPRAIENMVLMFQKEVAQRVVAGPHTKDYGLLSVMAQTFWRVDFVLEAGPRDFYPAPKVASRVLAFTRLQDPLGMVEVHEKRDFLSFLKKAFAQRRKYLLSNLKMAMPQTPWQDLFHLLHLDIQARAENLRPEDYVRLFQHWTGKIK